MFPMNLFIKKLWDTNMVQTLLVFDLISKNFLEIPQKKFIRGNKKLFGSKIL